MSVPHFPEGGEDGGIGGVKGSMGMGERRKCRVSGGSSPEGRGRGGGRHA